MDGVVILGVALLVAGICGFLVWSMYRTMLDSIQRAVQPPPPVPSSYTTLREESGPQPSGESMAPQARTTCATCGHWSREGGQKIMAMHPAFVEASKLVPPWRMGRALKTRPNPEHAETLEAIEKATSDEERRSLQAKLEAIPAEVPLAPEEQVDADLLHLEWGNFGACKKHSELRADSDRCDAWRAR